MNDLVIMKDKQTVTSSLQVAEVFEKNRRDVLRAIDNLEIGSAKLRSQMFAEGTYQMGVNQMNTNDYVFFGRCLVDGFLGLIGLALAGGLAWAVHEAVKDPQDFFGIK